MREKEREQRLNNASNAKIVGNDRLLLLVLLTVEGKIFELKISRQ